MSGRTAEEVAFDMHVSWFWFGGASFLLRQKKREETESFIQTFLLFGVLSMPALALHVVTALGRTAWCGAVKATPSESGAPRGPCKSLQDLKPSGLGAGEWWMNRCAVGGFAHVSLSVVLLACLVLSVGGKEEPGLLCPVIQPRLCLPLLPMVWYRTAALFLSLFLPLCLTVSASSL